MTTQELSLRGSTSREPLERLKPWGLNEVHIERVVTGLTDHLPVTVCAMAHVTPLPPHLKRLFLEIGHFDEHDVTWQRRKN